MSLNDMMTHNRESAESRRPVINRINDFLASPNFIVTIMLLTVVSNIFSMELAVYSIFTVAIVYTCLFGRDLLPLMPIFICCYIAPSVSNNPGRNEQSIFALSHGGIYLICLAGMIAAALIYRIVRDRRSFFATKFRLLPGMLILAGAYLLSGLGVPGYKGTAANNLLFAFAQSAAIVFPYLLFSVGVDWKNVRKDYFAWIGFCLGGVLICQILWIYFSTNVVVDGIIHRDRIYTGWGMYNNMGGMLAMMIPFAFYLATKYHKGWLGTVVGSAFLICILLTCSRSSILTGTVIYLICVVLMLYYARNRKGNTIAVITFVCITALALILFHRPILRLFSDLLNRGMDPSSRDTIYKQGLSLFVKYPLFGGSFFSPGYKPWDWSTSAGFSNFFPPRWHNTIIQLLASCGIVGLGAYLLHRVQTIRLLLSRPGKETTFIGCSVLALIACSMFDCHFFNIGPTLFYAMALAFAENCHNNI